MAERKIDLKKNVFSKSQYIKTINTQFSELGVTTLQEDLTSQIDVSQFFQAYNELFYEIPANGDTNSHEYLVKTSGEYIDFDLVQEEIEALRAEIAGLREENLELQVEITRFQTGEDIDIGSLIKEAEAQVSTEDTSTSSTLRSTSNTSISPSPTVSNNTTPSSGIGGGGGGGY